MTQRRDETKSERRGLTRRSFLKWSAAAGAGGVVLVGMPGLFRKLSRAEAAEITDYGQGKWIKSGCNMCGGQDGMDCFVDAQGVLRKIEPARDPGNLANVSTGWASQTALSGDKYEYGALCCKGNAGRRTLYDPDRLQSPMLRVGPRGAAESFVPISWDEAIQLSASKLKAVRASYGPRALFYFCEDHSFNNIQVDFTDAFGTRNFHNHSNLCDTARKASYKAVVGNDRPLPDFEAANYVLVFGWNFLSAIKWMLLAKTFARGRAKADFKFVYVDPIFNTTASKADQWLPVKPGTDGALALALCHRIINAAGTGNFDTAFVQAHGLGFEAFKGYLNNSGAYADGQVKNAAWAAGLTGLPQADIEALADELMAVFKAGKKILIDAWSGPGHKGNATQGGRAIAALMALFGAMDRSGSMVIPERSGPPRRAKDPAWPAPDGWRADGRDDAKLSEAAVATRKLVDKTGKIWNAGESVPAGTEFSKKFVYAHGSGSYYDAREVMVNQRDFLGFAYPVKGCVIVFQNLMMSMGDPERTRAALSNMDFVLVVDTHMSETALMADIVVPGSTCYERFDFTNRWTTFRVINLRQPVVKPWVPGGRSETQFLLDLGAAMAFPGFKTGPKNMTEEDLHKAEWEAFMSQGWATQKTWDQLKTDGLWIEDITTAKGGTHFEKYKKTATGKSFDAATMAVKAFGPTGAQIFTVVNKTTNAVLGFAASATPATYDEAPGIWATTSGKVQFWDPLLDAAFTGKVKPGGVDVTGDKRYHPLPHFMPQNEQPSTLYPLFFNSWKEVEHTHTRTFNNPWLMEMKGENRLWIHPSAASARSIEEEDVVWVASAYGSVKARAHLTFGIRPDVVGFVRGFGHWALGKRARGKGSHDGWLIPGRAGEVLSAQAVTKDLVCQVTKA